MVIMLTTMPERNKPAAGALLTGLESDGDFGSVTPLRPIYELRKETLISIK
jgi:hypothetical protein